VCSRFIINAYIFKIKILLQKSQNVILECCYVWIVVSPKFIWWNLIYNIIILNDKAFGEVT
jgi:hypothetical protein